MDPGGMDGISRMSVIVCETSGRSNPIRAGSDPDQFGVVFLDIGALDRGGRGFEPLNESAEL